MVSLTYVAGIVVILIGLALLGWALWEAVFEGAGVTQQFIILIIVGIILVIAGAWLARGGGINVSP